MGVVQDAPDVDDIKMGETGRPFGGLSQKFQAFLKWVQHYSDRPWYPEFVGVLAALDYWILVVPTDGLVIAGVVFSPKRWLRYGIVVPILSTIGAVTFAMFIGEHGLPFIQAHWPAIQQTATWTWTESFFDQYGLLVVFFVAATPLAQQPAIMIAALAQSPYSQLALAVFFGRLLKYMILCWLASHAPKVLEKLWGFKREMRETGVLSAEKEKG